jgi:hypothetical protein
MKYKTSGKLPCGLSDHENTYMFFFFANLSVFSHTYFENYRKKETAAMEEEARGQKDGTNERLKASKDAKGNFSALSTNDDDHEYEMEGCADDDMSEKHMEAYLHDAPTNEKSSEGNKKKGNTATTTNSSGIQMRKLKASLEKLEKESKQDKFKRKSPSSSPKTSANNNATPSQRTNSAASDNSSDDETANLDDDDDDAMVVPSTKMKLRGNRREEEEEEDEDDDEEMGEGDYNRMMMKGGGNELENMSEAEIKHAALAIIEEEERHHPIGKILFLVR